MRMAEIDGNADPCLQPSEKSRPWPGCVVQHVVANFRHQFNLPYCRIIFIIKKIILIINLYMKWVPITHRLMTIL